MTRSEFIEAIKPDEEFIFMVHKTRAIPSGAPFPRLYAAFLEWRGEEAKIDTFCGQCVMAFYDNLHNILFTHNLNNNL